MKHYILFTALAGAFSLISPLAIADDSLVPERNESKHFDGYEATGESKRCLNTSRIQRPYVANERTLMFEMRNGDKYVNVMQQACPGLSVTPAFNYYTRGTERLCSGNLITVKSLAVVAQSCNIGVFHKIRKIDSDG